MAHLLRKYRSTTTSPSIPTPPSESLIQKRLSTPHRGDVSALAASSIAVASSIGSPALNKVSSRQEAGPTWQTAYSTARMVIDITKESSDMFLPLKAVVGALSVLIKNYDVNSVPVPPEPTDRLHCSKPRVI